MKLGVVFSQHIIGGDPVLARDFAQQAEQLGYSYLVVYDHVVGVNPQAYPEWKGPYTTEDPFHDPFVLLSYIAASTTRIGLSPQIVILPQRQAVLVARQAASLDILSGGRLRLGIGVGWNKVEYIALNQNFHDRGKRSAEQLEVIHRLWREPHVEFDGEYHSLPNVGLSPRPTRPLDIWLGGHVDATFERIGRLGNGWLNVRYDANNIGPSLEKIHQAAKRAGRDPNCIGLDSWIRMRGSAEQWRGDIEAWRAAGATHLTVVLAAENRRDAASHLEALRTYIEATGDLFESAQHA